MATPLKPHPLSGLLPKPSPEEASDLQKSIVESGLRESIVLYQGMILDGNSRYEACMNSGVKPTYRQYDPEADGPDPKRFVVDKNLRRRHLTAAQKAAIAVKMLADVPAPPVVEASGPPPKKQPKPTIKDVAATTGLSERSVDMAVEAAKQNPAVIEQLASGQKTLHEIHKEVKDTKEKSARELLIEERGKELSRPLKQAVIAGTALGTVSQLKKWLDLELSPEQRLKLEPIILEGLPVQTALDFETLDLTPTTTLSFFLMRASLAEGGKYEQTIKNGPGCKRGLRYRVIIECYAEAKGAK